MRQAVIGEQVDICIFLDVTHSMHWCRDEIANHICGFADELSEQQMDWRVALYAFRDLKNGEHPVIHGFTSQADVIKTRVKAFKAKGGGGNGGESSIDALFDGLGHYEFRPQASRCFVLFTDDNPHDPDQQGRTMDDLVRALLRERVVTYAVTKRVPPFVSLANGSDGFHFDIKASRGGFRQMFRCFGQSISLSSRRHNAVAQAAQAALAAKRLDVPTRIMSSSRLPALDGGAG